MRGVGCLSYLYTCFILCPFLPCSVPGSWSYGWHFWDHMPVGFWLGLTNGRHPRLEGSRRERSGYLSLPLLWQWHPLSRNSLSTVALALTRLPCHHFLPLLSSPKGGKAALCCWCLGAQLPVVGSVSPTHTSINIPFVSLLFWTSWIIS